jgi:hypothetical protein
MQQRRKQSDPAALPTIPDCFNRIQELMTADPRLTNTILTEFHAILNKAMPSPKGLPPKFPLVPDDFNPEKVLKLIQETAELPLLKIPQIRYKADELAKKRKIPLPDSTRKHRDPLLQWFHVYWNELSDDIPHWKERTIPNAD